VTQLGELLRIDWTATGNRAGRITGQNSEKEETRQRYSTQANQCADDLPTKIA